VLSPHALSERAIVLAPAAMHARDHITQAVLTSVVHHAAAKGSISYFQAIVLGLLQGVSELFPISSLGHTVIFPQLFGWHSLSAAEARPESFWLAFIVGLHVGTALALVVFYFRTWIDIVVGLFRSIVRRRIETSTERLGWLLVVATIPAGIIGLAFEHPLRVLFTKPLLASIFLIVNGLILAFGESVRRGAEQREAKGIKPKRSLDTFQFQEAGVIGAAQVSALIAGISRSGITIVAGLVRGLNHEDSARFSFLLATPIILAAGILKIPDLTGPLGNGIRGQAIVGALCAAAAAFVSVAFLTRYFKTKTLWPFAAYCIAAGIACTAYFG
jgi:undecaprenyl-diphosphatase